MAPVSAVWPDIDELCTLQKPAEAGAQRSAGQPFFGQAENAQLDSPSLDTSSGGQAKPSGNGFFGADGAGGSTAAAQPPPTQTLKMQQAAARSRAQRPSGKKPDPKPVFKVQALLAALVRHCA